MLESQKTGKQERSVKYFIEYINLLRGQKEKINEIRELSNGVYLNEILSGMREISIVNGFYEEPSTFVQSLSNLKMIVRQVEKYRLERLGIERKIEIDLVNIVQKGQEQEIVKMIELIIGTLFLSCQKQQFIEKILLASEQTQGFFMDFMNRESLINSQNGMKESLIKSQNKVKEQRNISVYHKLQQLQNQNEQLIKIIQQLQHTNLLLNQKQKQFEERSKEDSREISVLKEQLNMLRLKSYQNQDEMSKGQKQIIEEEIDERIEEYKQKEMRMLEEIQALRELTQSQRQEINKLKATNKKYDGLSESYNKVLAEKQSLSGQLLKIKTKLSQIEEKLSSSLQINQLKTQEISALKTSLNNYIKQLSTKTQLVQQLENNVKYLLQGQPQSTIKQSQSNTKQPTLPLKQECQSTIINNKQQLILIKLNQQNVFLNRQFKEQLQVNQILQKQTHKLKQQLQKMRLFQDENSKLVQMISHMHKYRGQENQLLIKSLYQMRLKLLKTQSNTINTHTLKQINRNY